MPDEISDDERRMIDARLAAGLYTVCPPFMRTEALEPEPTPLRELIRRESVAGKAEAILFQRRSALDARRDQVALFHHAQYSVGEISARLGIRPRTIEGDLTVLRRVGRIG